MKEGWKIKEKWNQFGENKIRFDVANDLYILKSDSANYVALSFC